MLVEFILGVSVLLLFAWIWLKKPSGLPPGKWGLPLVGHIPRGGKYIDDVLKDFQKQYGDVYLWKFGSQIQVIVHDYEIGKQMFSNQDFVNRPDLQSIKDESGNSYGIFATNGSHWQTNRRFALRQLRDMGMGKSSLVAAVHEQVPVLLNAIKKNDGKETSVPHALNTAIVNIIWKMIADTQFDSEDPRHKDLQQLIILINDNFEYVAMADMFSALKYIIPKPIFRKWFRIDLVNDAQAEFFKYFEEIIEEHQKVLNTENPRDIIEAYLADMKENQEPDSTRCISDLKFLLFDMFSAGSDTTTHTMRFIFLYMAAFPDKQRKLQEEIDRVLQKGVLATLDDRPSMPYTDAVINEVLRKSSLTSMGVHHSAVRDTTLAGYRIPKDTLVTTASMSIHHDERYWENPDRFLPERWISPEGKFVMKKEGYLPFSTGKRSCIGEGMARMELFIFTTAVFQKYSVSAPEGRQINLMPKQDTQFFHEPTEQDIVFTSRS